MIARRVWRRKGKIRSKQHLNCPQSIRVPMMASVRGFIIVIIIMIFSRSGIGSPSYIALNLPFNITWPKYVTGKDKISCLKDKTKLYVGITRAFSLNPNFV